MLVEIFCDKFRTGGKDGAVRPAFLFHNGLNAVIGDSNRSNSIGKSTLLMIIDFVFGGEDYIDKCSSVHKNVGEHTIYFTLSFDGVEQSFGRNSVEHKEVFRCDRKYNRLDCEPMKIDAYKRYLSEKYGLISNGLTWRGVMSKYIRIHRRDTMDYSRPLQSSKDAKVSDSIKTYMKQFNRYDTVEKHIIQAKNAEDERDAFKKSVSFKHISMAGTDIEYKNNEELAALLEAQEKELAENSNKGLLNLTEMQLKRLNFLNDLLVSYTRQSARVSAQLNSIRKEMTDGKKSFKKTYSDLERFFPGIDFKEISEIEDFHKSLSKVLTAEFKDSEKDLAATCEMLNDEIVRIKEEIAEIKNVPNVSQAVLKEYAKIATELSNVRKANENYETSKRLKEIAKKLGEKRDEIIATELSAINDKVNKAMRDINTRLMGDKAVIPPVLNIEKLNSYEFETEVDDGSGAANRGVITFDLANMELLNIPFIIHDADLMDPIEKQTLTAIIKEYAAVKEKHRQAFVSFRSFEFYADEAKPFLENSKVIELEANGQELFGWAWNKEKMEEK